MITSLSEQKCFDLLRTTTVGRFGFVRDARVQIIPVNYFLDDRDIVVRTAPDSVLSMLPASELEVAFEVDHHDDLAGTGWSVLLNGTVSAMPVDELDAVPASGRVHPWAGGDRDLPLRLHVHAVSGRSVQRPRR
ncbi:pyridoxamine 5'-phosphate oxidase family protein [Microbacterium sp. LWH12-1.2]|uniref:pyridoxamine 5'-phosphate oxidase family protein n=1 Tax=Microbacterium sp. LWH12-1.2 TaxID=3135259 RepID=UPI00324361C8